MFKTHRAKKKKKTKNWGQSSNFVTETVLPCSDIWNWLFWKVKERGEVFKISFSDVFSDKNLNSLHLFDAIDCRKWSDIRYKIVYIIQLKNFQGLRIDLKAFYFHWLVWREKALVIMLQKESINNPLII